MAMNHEADATNGMSSRGAERTLVIGVCTCRRPNMLRDCLKSLARLNLPESLSVSVAVIDNDAEASARDCVEQIREGFPLLLNYFVEERQGIPFARNRALDEALAENVNHLAFIDDDETADEDWLIHGYAMHQSYGNDAIVTGPVVHRLPENVPPSIAGLYNRSKSKPTGMQMTTCATNNVILPMSLVRQQQLRFDESRPKAGGTDTIFFRQASMAGAVIVWCAEAKVYEQVPESRANLKWWMRRKFRVGVNDARSKRSKGRSRLSVLASSICQMPYEAVKFLLFMITIQKLKMNRALLSCIRSAGVSYGVFGGRIDSYRKLDGE